MNADTNTKTKIKDWFLITRIRILNFIGEHKYISAAIGIFLLSLIIALVVRAATNETISNATARVDNLSVSTEGDDGVAPNFTKVTYTLHFTLQDQNQCQNEGNVYQADEVTIIAKLPDNVDTNNVKWLGADENAFSDISKDGKTLTVKISPVNVCSGQSQLFTLSILNANKDTTITPTISIQGGKNASVVPVNDVKSVKTTYDKEYELTPVVKSGVARKIEGSNDRNVRFGILLGVNIDSDEETVSLKGAHLKTSADLLLTAEQGTKPEYLTLYTKNETNFNGEFDGNYFGINNESRHYFASDVLPDLSSTSGKITSFSRTPSSDATEGTVDTQNVAPNAKFVGDTNVEIEKYPESSDATFREELDDSRITVNGSSSSDIKETVYKDGQEVQGNEIKLNEIGSYEINYNVKLNNKSNVTFKRKVNVVEPQNSSYSLIGAKTVYIKKYSIFSDDGLYNRETAEKASSLLDYSVKYYKADSDEEILSTSMPLNTGTYRQEYTINDSDEKITRTIIVVDDLPTISTDQISVKTVNKYGDEEVTDHKISVNNNEVTCNGDNNCSYKKEDDGSYLYTINRSNDNYVVEIIRDINNLPSQYKLSINNILPTDYVNRTSDGFYAVGAYYVTVKSTRTESETGDINVKLSAKLGDKTSSASVENKEFASGYETTSLTSTMYVVENSQNVAVDSSDKNGLYGNYYTAAMGEEVTLMSRFEYGNDADNDISELNINIPVNKNLIPISYSENVSENSYFYIRATYNNSVIDALPNFTIQYCDASGKCFAPEEFDSSSQVVDHINITIKPSEDGNFKIRAGTLIEIGTKYKVKTYSATDPEASDLANLKFNSSATFTWKNGSENFEKTSSTPDVYITPYKSRATVNIGKTDDYSSADVVILDASKNDNYTVFTTLDVVSPAMNISSNIFGYNRLENFVVQFTLPEGINYVYNNNYEMEPSISYNNENTILTYTYTSVEPNSWIEPIYFDFNVDVTSISGDFEIAVSAGNTSGTDTSIRNDLSSINKYKTKTKKIRIENTEPVSYGQYIYSNDRYISNINKGDSFDFSTKLFNNAIPSDNDVSDVNVYTVLPYTDEVNGSSYTGSLQLENLPSNAMCTADDPSLVTSENLKDQVKWSSCNDFKTSDGKYSGLTAFKVSYDTLGVQQPATTTIKVNTINNDADDVYTFKSYLEYKNKNGTSSGYKNFKDIQIVVISKQITGVVWEDFNVDGIMDDDEKKIDAVTLELYDSNDNLINTTSPNKDGVYSFSALEEGNYYIVAKFNTEKYGATGQPSEDFYDKTRLSAFKEVPLETTTDDDTNDDPQEDDQASDDSSSVADENDDQVNDDGETEQTPQIKTIIKTDIINVNSETRIIRNINLGLSLKKVFELKVNKYITKAEVTNAFGVVTNKEYGNVKLAKLDVKDINNVNIKVIYTIEIQNVKYYPGYATLITEEIPDGMSFNPDYSENKGWVVNGDGTLSNTTLSDQIIEENEKKYLTVAFDITRKEAGSFVNFVSVDELQVLGGND